MDEPLRAAPEGALDDLDIRVGMILAAEEHYRTERPAFKLWIDFGEPFGVRRACAEMTRNYRREDLPGMLVMGIVNLPPRDVAGFGTDVRLLGVPDHRGRFVLLEPERDTPLGVRAYDSGPPCPETPRATPHPAANAGDRTLRPGAGTASDGNSADSSSSDDPSPDTPPDETEAP